MTNEFSVGWAKVRDRDVLGGFVIFVFANLLLLGLVVIGSDVLGHDGSHDAKVAFGIITVALNLMLWLWNDGAIADAELLRNGDIYWMAPSTLRSNYRT